MFEHYTPHGDKLTSLLGNSKLPETDRPRLGLTIERYREWVEQLRAVEGTSPDSVTILVTLLNEYKNHIDLELIFDSPQNFLYRQKGQLKLDNSVIEEFIPILVTTVLGDDLKELDLSVGPISSFAGLRFEEGIRTARDGAGLRIRSKDQDFAISRRLYLQASHYSDFRDSTPQETNVAYVATEIKTNLDKTMFQEAAATALDVKSVVPGARYYLLCEWLDMVPISTSTTAIDEVIVLRRAKRLPSNVRRNFSTAEGRLCGRAAFQQYLDEHAMNPEPFSRYIDHIRGLVSSIAEEDVLARGFF